MTIVRRVLLFSLFFSIISVGGPQAVLACDDCNSDPWGYSVGTSNSTSGQWADCQNGQQMCWNLTGRGQICQPYCGNTHCYVV